MTSQERVMAACNFTEPDRVPIDIGGTDCSDICIDEYCDILKALKSDIVPAVVNQAHMIARFDPVVLERLHGDVVILERPIMSFHLDNREMKEWTTFAGNRVKMPSNFHPRIDEDGGLWIDDENGQPAAHMPKGGYYFDFAIGTSVRDDIPKLTEAEIRATRPLLKDDELKYIQEQARLMRLTGKAVVGCITEARLGTFARPFAGMSPTEFMIMLALEPDYMNDVFAISIDQGIENMRLYMQATGDNMDIIQMSGVDYGTQRGEMISPEVYKQIFLPHHKRANDFVHQNSAYKTFIHCCGSIRNLIPHFIDAGFDILNPVQVSANNMEADKLKADFGGKIVFWGGGVSTQQTLPFGTVEEIRAEVKRNIEAFAPGGGYVFAAEHCIQSGIPVENVFAAADAAYEFGAYPIRKK